ncbi:MAG: hypothetical protein E7262_01080 [Lachnospiraceae bacterium]|nr:hypothetical protein [Lachnospiraceae bacterium]
MGYDKYLHIGDRVTILYDGESYNSKIVRFVKKIKGVENIVILLPTKNNTSMKTDDDKSKYEVLFYTKGGVYRGGCKIIDRYREDGVVAVLEIAITSDLEKYQRREYFRIDYIDKIQFKVLVVKNEETGQLEEKEDTWHKGTLTNISGGGLRFSASEGYENAKKIQVKFSLKDHEDNGEYDIEADIVGINIRAHSEKKYDYRIQYAKIDKVERESIVRFVFERERWMRKKAIGKI